MTRKSWLILLLATGFIGVLALSLYLVKQFSASPAGTAENIRQAIGSESSSPAAIPKFDSEIDRTLLLPPSNTPLVQVIGQLEKKALTGSSKAACRISQDIRRCANASAQLDLAETLSSVPVLPGRKESISEELLQQSQKDGDFCAQVPATMLSKGYEFQRIAANSGNKTYGRWLVAAPALDRQNFLSNLDEWQDYRKRAGNYVSEALANRSGEDFILLLGVYAPKNVTGIRPPYQIADDQTFLALMKVAQKQGLRVPTDINAAADRIFDTLSRKEMDLIDARAAELGGGWHFESLPALPYEEVVKAASDSFCR